MRDHGRRRVRGLQKFFELLRRQPGVFGEVRHRESVDVVMARDGEPDAPVGHDGMLAFPRDAEAILPNARTACAWLMPGSFGISDGDHVSLDRLEAAFLGFDFQPFADGDADIVHRLLPGGSLGMTAGKRGATDGPAFV